jgi:hypothetical protein
VLISSKTDGKFGYFVWTKAKRSTVWEHFEQGADIQNGSPKTLCKGCWKVFAHPELRTGGSSTSTLWRCVPPRILTLTAFKLFCGGGGYITFYGTFSASSRSYQAGGIAHPLLSLFVAL